MKKLKNKKGMTLVEIIVALAIIGILAIGFLTIFTSSFNHIFRMGNKTAAMSQAQEIVDEIYIAGSTTGIVDSFEQVTNCSQIETTPINSSEVQYCIASEVIQNETFQRVTIKVFYRNGNEHVTLSTIIP